MSGGIAGRGRPGLAGPQGPVGPVGPKGDDAFTLAIGAVTAVPYGEDPEVTNVGTAQDQVWNLALVTGATGVLTGVAPPTGSDGTSLGQLYYCTTNQVYYGLVELGEADNKWRPIMTQSNAIRTYNFDIISNEGAGAATGTKKIAGHASVVLDDVERKLVMSLRFRSTVPIGTGQWQSSMYHYIDAAEQNALIADAAVRGITAIPFTYSTRMNGVAGTGTGNLLGRSSSLNSVNSYDVPLDELIPDVHGTGTQPGAHAYWDHGQVAVKANETSAGSATTYGDPAELGLMAAEASVPFMVIDSDTEYPISVGASVIVEVPYV